MNDLDLHLDEIADTAGFAVGTRILVVCDNQRTSDYVKEKLRKSYCFVDAYKCV
jgi:hypothetical protein